MHALLNSVCPYHKRWQVKIYSSNGSWCVVCYDSKEGECRCVLKIAFYLSFMKLLEKGNVVEGCVG